ncbi:hypothetical protein Tco_1088717 [Tanacetum coccineum]
MDYFWVRELNSNFRTAKQVILHFDHKMSQLVLPLFSGMVTVIDDMPYSCLIELPNAICNELPELDVEMTSLDRDEWIIGNSMPETISLMYNLVWVSILSVALVGMKCANLVRRSTMTQIVSCPFEVLGSFVMKSSVILSPFT